MKLFTENDKLILKVIRHQKMKEMVKKIEEK